MPADRGAQDIADFDAPFMKIAEAEPDLDIERKLGKADQVFWKLTCCKCLIFNAEDGS